MGCWGRHLFEGDMDLDVVSETSAEAGVNLIHFGIHDINPDDSDDRGPKSLGLEATRALLNNGRLPCMFEKYKTNKNLFPSNNYYIVILGALAMGVGATITPEHMELLHNVHQKIPIAIGYTLPIFDFGFRTEGAAQFKDALNEYKNDGTPWDFSTQGQNEKEVELTKQNTRDFKACKKCGTLQADLPDKRKPKACGKCKRVAYCTKDCQKWDWKNHKKDCEPANASNITNPHAPICLNQ